MAEDTVPMWAVELAKAINKVEYSLDILAERQRMTNEDLAALKCDVVELRKILQGNGEPGIKGRVQRLDDWSAGQRKFQWAVVGIALTEITAGIVWVILKVVQLP